LSVAEVLRGTFRIYRHRFMTFMIASGIVSVPGALGMAAFEVVPEPNDGAPALRLAYYALPLIGIVLSGAADLLASGAAILLTSSMILGQSAQLLEAYRLAAHRFVPLCVAGLVAFLAFTCGMGIVLVPVAAAARGSDLGPPASFLLSLAILVLPVAVLVLVGWLLVLHLVLLERLGAIDALRRSQGIMRWHRRRLLLCVLPFAFIYMALYSAPACLLTYGYGPEIWPDTCWGSAPAPTALKVGTALLSGITNALAGPLPLIVTTLLYYDLRVADEGLDLDLHAAIGETPSP